MQREVRDHMKLTVKTPGEFIRYPGVAGCQVGCSSPHPRWLATTPCWQVKMLTGARCAGNATVDEARIKAAIGRMKLAAFVGEPKLALQSAGHSLWWTTARMHAGITDEWDSSICLFHAMYGGRQLPIEFQNTRPTTSFST